MAVPFCMLLKMTKILRRFPLTPMRYTYLLAALSPPWILKMAPFGFRSNSGACSDNWPNAVLRRLAPQDPPNLAAILIMLIPPSVRAQIRMRPNPNSGALVLKKLEMGRMMNRVNVTSFRRSPPPDPPS